MRPVIFIHGMFMTPLCWDGWMRHFAAGSPELDPSGSAVSSSIQKRSDGNRARKARPAPESARSRGEPRRALPGEGGGTPPSIDGLVSPARAKHEPERTHYTLAQKGWEEVADFVIDWLGKS
jgi:hypothetical protein